LRRKFETQYKLSPYPVDARRDLTSLENTTIILEQNRLVLHFSHCYYSLSIIGNVGAPCADIETKGKAGGEFANARLQPRLTKRSQRGFYSNLTSNKISIIFLV